MATITQAFVLGAGLGKRLRPLTDDLPKPLIPIFQKPLITFALDHLLSLDVQSFVINTHHRPERFADVFGGDDGPHGAKASLQNFYRGYESTLRLAQALL